MNRFIVRSISSSARLMMPHELGAGAGKSGGSGGSIREAGGAFGKMEAAREEEYFYKLQKSQLKQLKDQLAREVEHHEQQQKNHAEAIQRHKKRMQELDNETKALDGQ